MPGCIDIDLCTNSPPFGLAFWYRWFGPPDGKNNITAADFDALLGHAVAVTDTASSVFAAEMIAAYPDAKVILNQRKSISEWHESIKNTIGRARGHWHLFLLTCLSREGFWGWQSHVRFMYPGMFRAIDGDIWTGIARNGKWVYRGMEQTHNTQITYTGEVY
jgi:hypothetical protein